MYFPCPPAVNPRLTDIAKVRVIPFLYRPLANYADARPAERPRLGPSGSLKIPSPAPTPVVNPYAPSQRSRLSQSTSRRRQASIFGDEDDDFDADGDADADAGEDVEGEGEEGGDPEDQQIYCFCQKLSYGEVRPCLHSFIFYIYGSFLCG